MDAIQTIDYKGYKINICYDDVADSPQEMMMGDDNVILVFDHRDFNITHPDFNAREIFENGEKVKGYHVFRCYAYIHGGVALSVGSNSKWPDQKWDVSFKGFWLVKREKGTWTEKHARLRAEGWCKVWNQYLSGEIYGYSIDSPDEEGISSCWGYYGDPEESGLIAEAKHEIDFLIECENLKPTENEIGKL